MFFSSLDSFSTSMRVSPWVGKKKKKNTLDERKLKKKKKGLQTCGDS